jgi:hypothetical protein
MSDKIGKVNVVVDNPPIKVSVNNNAGNAGVNTQKVEKVNIGIDNQINVSVVSPDSPKAVAISYGGVAGSATSNADINYIRGVDLTQNTNIRNIDTKAQAAFDKANITYTSSNTAYLLDGLIAANANIAYILGVDLTQNTNIQAAFNQANTANTLAQAAYNAISGAVLYDQNLNTSNSVSFAGLSITGNTNSQNIIPTLNNTYNLGAPNLRFKDIYLSNSSIYLGNSVISETSYSNLNQNVASSYTKANNAYNQANTALTVAQSAYNQANTSGSASSQAAFDKANSANVLAQAAFDKANTAGAASSQAAFDKANSANVLAQAAFNQANSASSNTIIFQGALNTANANIAYILGIDLTQNTNISNIDTKAQAAFDKANTVSSITNVDIKAQASFEKANAAFDKANSANVLAQSAFDNSNTGNVLAQSAFDKANTANVLAQSAFSKANTANVLAQSSFNQANSANILAQSAFNQANTASSNTITLQGALNTANANIAYILGIDSTQNTNISNVDTKSQSAFNQANSANVLAQAAFDRANTSGAASSQAAFDKANSANVLAQSSFNQANSANVLAQAAFDRANTSSSNTIILQGALNTANANIAYLYGVNTEQNTAINSKFNSSGGTISGSVIIQKDLTVQGNVSYTGNVTSITVTGNTGQFFGYAANGFNALYAGIPVGYLVEPQIVTQFSSNFDGYSGLNMQNINSGPNASFDLFLTADNGTPLDGYVDLGIASSNYNYSGYSVIGKNDGYLFAYGNTSTGGGNMIIGTGLNNDIIFTTGGLDTQNIVMRISGTAGSNVVSIISNIKSTSTTSGALQVKGGVGVTGNVYAGNVYSGGSLVLTSEPIGISAASNTVYIQGALNTANANIAYILSVNTLQNTNIQAAFDKSNSANILAQSSFNQANSANVLAQSSFDKANSANVLAQSSFDKANSANVLAQSAYNAANNVVLYDQNLNTSNSVSFAGLSVTGDTNSQNIISTTDNTYSLGSSGFRFKDIYAGSSIYLGSTVISEVSYLNLNQNVAGSYNKANIAYNQANTALSVAQAAYNKANTGGGGGGTSTGVVKTYNILNEFSAPLIGNQIFVPVQSTTLTKIQITNGEIASSDIMLGLYKNNELITFVTLPSGSVSTTITGLSYYIQTNDFITVNVVAGAGKNLMMTLFDN